MYDKRATLECHCDGVTLIGRPSIAAYWAPKLALASATAFSMDDVLLTADGVCLDFEIMKATQYGCCSGSHPRAILHRNAGCSVNVAWPEPTGDRNKWQNNALEPRGHNEEK
jgi:hypothetical protein